jgi:hypothetical protein
MEVLIGALAGVLAAMVCTAFYTKGVRDGARVRGVKRKSVQKDETQSAEPELVRKFDAILDYDPYCSEGRERVEGEGA